MKTQIIRAIAIINMMFFGIEHCAACYNQPPVVDFVITPDHIEEYETVTLDASGSYDPDGAIAYYYFDVDGDGNWFGAEDYCEMAWDAPDGNFDGKYNYSGYSTGIYAVRVAVSDGVNWVYGTSNAYVQVICVPADANTIQGAIDMATDGYIVIVDEGTYYETIDFNDKSIVLTSADPNDWDVVAATIINGGGSNPVVDIDCNAVLTGFSVTGGGSGADVYCSGGTAAISRCIMDNCTHCVYAVNAASADISNCKMNGGSFGVHVDTSGIVDVSNCLIYGTNLGVYCSNSSADVGVVNCTIADNLSGGVYAYSGSVTVTDCILWNTDEDADDLYGCSATYSCIHDSDAGTGNIVGDANDPNFVNANNGNYRIRNDSPCIDAANGSSAPALDIDGCPALDNPEVTNTGAGDPNYKDMGAYENWQEFINWGMTVDSVSKDANGVVTVITTGAQYVLDGNGMEMYSSIDPNTNDYRNPPRLVAELTFGANIGALSIYNWDAYKARIESDKATFDFYGDSLFFIIAKDELVYDHNSVINEKYNAPLIEYGYTRGVDRLWTDGYGGSLSAQVSGVVTTADSNEDYVEINMDEGAMTAHMVFPPKKFDFEGLYGENAKPFSFHFYSAADMQNTVDANDEIISDAFGEFLIWNYFYDGDSYLYKPDVFEPNGILEYRIEPNYASDINDFVELMHSKGACVTAYLYGTVASCWNYPAGHAEAGQHQPVETTLQMMRELQDMWHFDGWYFDNANAGNLIEDYRFMRQVRTDVGPQGFIRHHDSVDVWGYDTAGSYSGLRAMMVNAYVNTTLVGETGAPAYVHEPNNPYFRYYTCGYGMSQAYSSHKLESHGCASLSDNEMCRLLGENLHGCQRDFMGGIRYYTSWANYFKPAYDEQADLWQNDRNNFDPDVDWPIDGSTGWFRVPTAYDVNDVNYVDESSLDNNSVTIRWVTNENSDSVVSYIKSDSFWWRYKVGEIWHNPDPNVTDPDNPSRKIAAYVEDTNGVTSHSLMITGLDANTSYHFRIRSSDGDPNVLDEVIWGYVGTFRTEQ